MLLEIKQEIFNMLQNELGYRVTDNPYQQELEEIFPTVFLTVSNANRVNVKNNGFICKFTFKIDIFSEYNGEKEIILMEEDIAALLPDLMERFEYIVGVSEHSFKILDDKSTSVVRKHGVILYSITAAGQYKEV